MRCLSSSAETLADSGGGTLVCTGGADSCVPNPAAGEVVVRSSFRFSCLGLLSSKDKTSECNPLSRVQGSPLRGLLGELALSLSLSPILSLLILP